MNQNRYDLQWIGHFKKNTSDKIWGWFYFNGSDANVTNTREYCYVFWARTGKTPNFKKHYAFIMHMRQLEAKKLDGKYQRITEQDLLNMWPSFFEDIERKFIFHILADDI